MNQLHPIFREALAPFARHVPPSVLEHEARYGRELGERLDKLMRRMRELAARNSGSSIMSEQTATVDGLMALVFTCRNSPASARAVEAVRAYAERLAADSVLPAEEPRRWRWVDCTPHEGYFDRRADGEWVMWSDVAHLFGVALAPRCLPSAECNDPRLCAANGKCQRREMDDASGAKGLDDAHQ